MVANIHAHISRLGSSVLPGAYLVELFPFMKKFPSWIAKWKREGEGWHRKDTEMFEGFINGVSEKIVSSPLLVPRYDMSLIELTKATGRGGSSSSTFVESLIENQAKYGLTKKQTAWLAGTML